ncbi:hypothetical protein CAEBREN_02737 [Caenorhabditis brenneri]|uniref:Uncharacterized protein n=1 Tax=Caenorhabditis brenneri TaxID=135651 RepID=G0N630_CAEBE|nr:hypothetical protein CAEBREN_02737 [Caenorhabditis brenneri]
MDPQHQRGFLVSGQQPPEMNLQPPDKYLNLGQLGTPASMNQFYPGSRETDPINDVNNLPVPNRNYHHQPEPVHDKLVINTDFMLPRAVEGSRSDDELIKLSQEQNGTARIFSSSSPGLLDIHHAQSPMNSPDNTHMMDYGMFDMGPDQDEIIHRVQFSDSNERNSNFGSPAFDEHPIEDDRAMETQGEASHDGHDDDLEPDPERQTGHNVNSLPIAPAQFAHGTGQFENDAYFRDGPQVEGGTVDHTFGDDQDVAGHEGQLHVEQPLQTSGPTYNSGQHVSNSVTLYAVGAQEHLEFCQPQVDGQGGHQAGHGPMGPLSYRHGGYYPRMDEVHQQAERQTLNRNGAPVFSQSNSTDRIVQDGTVEHIGHEGQLHVEQTFETSGQTYNFTDNRDAPPVVWASDQQMGSLPGNLTNVPPNSDAPRGLSARKHQNRPEPADTTVGEFCQRRMEMQWQAERQQRAMSNRAPQSNGNHFYQDNLWRQPTTGGPQAGHGSMEPLSYGRGDYYPQMDEVLQQAERQQYDWNGTPAFPHSYNGDCTILGEAVRHTGHGSQLHVQQTLEISGQTDNTGNIAQNKSNNDASHFVCAPEQPVGCLPGNMVNASHAANVTSAQQASERQRGTTTNGALCQEQLWSQPTFGDHQAGHRSMEPLSHGHGDYYPQMDKDHRQAERQHGSIRIGAPQAEQQTVFNGTMRPLSYGQGDYHPVMGKGTLQRFTPHGPRQEVQQGMNLRYQGAESGSYQANSGDVGAADNITGGPRNCRLDFQRIKRNTQSASLSDHADDQISLSEESGVYSYPSTPDQTTTDSSTNGLHPPIFTYEDALDGINLRYQGAESGSYQKNSGVVEAADNLTGELRNCHLDFQRIKENTRSASASSEESGIYSYPSTPNQTTTDGSTNGLLPPISTYEGAESGSYQINSGIVEAADNLTGGPGNCRLDFQWIKMNSRSASLSDHTDDQISSSEESGFYSSPSTPDQTTTDGSTNGLLPPIFTSEEPPLNQLFLPDFTVQSKDDEAFQQAQWDILMDYSDEELERMDNNGFLLIDNNDTIGFDVDRLCETYEYYASGMNNMLPLDILSNNESDNNEGSFSSSTPEKKRRNRRSGLKMTPEQKKAHKKEANRKYSTISRDKKKSERDVTNRIWKYIQNEIQIQQAAITDVENNVEFANELLELTGQSSDLHDILQQESQVYMYWKGEISRVSDIRRDEDTKVQDALLKKQSAKEKFEKYGVEYQAKDGGKKTTTIGSQKTRALQNHELVKAQYHILVNRHDLRREKFLKGLADLYFRRTVSRYIQRIWTIPVEVHQLLSQEQKLHQLDKLKNFLQANRHLLKAPS